MFEFRCYSVRSGAYLGTVIAKNRRQAARLAASKWSRVGKVKLGTSQIVR